MSIIDIIINTILYELFKNGKYLSFTQCFSLLILLFSMSQRFFGTYRTDYNQTSPIIMKSTVVVR